MRKSFRPSALLPFYLLLTLVIFTACSPGNRHKPVGGSVQPKPQGGGNDPLSKLVNRCSTCHGTDGLSVQTGVPNLAGQKETYLMAQLQKFKSNERIDNTMQMMNGMASSLSDSDMNLVVGYFSKSSAAKPSGDTSGVSKAAKTMAQNVCMACHTQAASAIGPYLFGQPEAYLVNQLKYFKEKSRKNEMMNGVAAGIDDAMIPELAKFFKNYKP